jgi:hypothetical protein
MRASGHMVNVALHHGQHGWIRKNYRISAILFYPQNPKREIPHDRTTKARAALRGDNPSSEEARRRGDSDRPAETESDGHRHISGTGGQPQLVRGAYASKGGKSFICLSSTYEKRGERRSRIVFTLTLGNIVTTPRSDVMLI